MTALGQKLMNDALDAIRLSVTMPEPEPTMPDRTLRQSVNLSLVAERIAQCLSDAAHIEVGLPPVPLKDVVQPTRQRFRDLAEQAIESLNPLRYDAGIEHTVAAMLNWSEGYLPTSGPVGTEDIVREALSRFIAFENAPRVTR